MREPPLEFNHAYPTCVETYSTLRIFSEVIPPDEITRVLTLEATSHHRLGDPHAQGRLTRKSHGWFYEIQAFSTSRDSSYHIELILQALAGKSAAVAALQDRGCQLDVCSFWIGIGHGGPDLHPDQMRRLGALGLPIWGDVYFDEEQAAAPCQQSQNAG